MDNHILSKVKGNLKKQRNVKRWQKVVGFLAAIVVFCTTYALILPAITMSKTLVCTLEEHTHTEECYVQERIMDCELEEMEGHKHTESCYMDNRTLSCQKQESQGHVHGEGCFLKEQILTCEQQTVELQDGHKHGETCYDEEQNLICLTEESEPVEVVVHEHTESCYTEQTTQICGLEEIEAHVHTEACYEGEITLVCELEEIDGHTHSEECSHMENVLICEKAEHAHEEECYASSKSDPTADVETAEIWEATFAGVELTGDWATDVLAIAETQLGYTESKKNFVENELGEQSGYTRYGAWYGVPYGDWCAMFISFCLNYAEVEAFPMEANCQNWIEQLTEEPYGIYREAKEYVPKTGDLIFFDTDLDGVCHHVGIVAEVELGEEDTISTVKVLEGNSVHDSVEYITYELSDPKIMGYGELIQPKEESDISTNLLTYEDETMTVTATFPEEYMIPENAVLSVKMIDAQTDEETFEKMYQSVKDTMVTQDNRVLGSLNLYSIEMLADEQMVEVPADLQVLLNITYKETLYDEEEMALAAELAVVAIEEPVMQTFALRDVEELDSSYYATMPDATIDNASDGVTGFSLENYGLQPFGVATTYEVKKGNVWKRVKSLDEIQNEDTLLIVSVEGNVALTYGDTSKGVAVIMEQVKGNPEYYDVTLRSEHTSFAESGNHLSSKFKVSNKNNSSFKLSNLSSVTQYLRLSGGTVFNTTETALTLERRETENSWNIKSDKYYLSYDRDDEMLSSNNSQKSRRDMFLLKLVDEELLIPNDTEVVNEGLLNLPDQPQYDTVEPSGEKTGNTTVEELKGFSVEYASDSATSNLEDKFTGIKEDDGKVLTDKSVVYMADDYGAFTDYADGTFGVTLSALGQVSSTAGELKPLMDIVIILDTSYSMINNSNNYLDSQGKVRMEWAMTAVNSVIDQALAAGNNRIGLVTFSDTSQVVLPLDHYTTKDGQYLDLEADRSITDTNHGRGNNFYDLNINPNVKNSNNLTPTFDFQYGPGKPNWEGTFTQSGIAEAAKILLKNPDTTDANGNARQPVIILITDGGPTLCSSNYKDPLAGPIYGNSGQTAEKDHDRGHYSSDNLPSDGTGGNRYGINGYYTVLTAQYYKNLVGSHYALQTKFATVGIGIGIDSTQGSGTDKRLHDNRYCRAVLDPNEEKLAAAMNTFDGFEHEGQQFNQLLKNTFDEQYVSIPNHSDGYTTIGTTYSAVPVLENPYTDFDYADQYYDGKSVELADELVDYLQKIQFQEYAWRTIIETQTDVEMEDPIGRGMEVKGEPILRFGKANYTPTNTLVEGNTTTYVYNYPVLYREAYSENAESDNRNVETTLNLSRIEVTVTTEGEGIDAFQTVKMHVPEELLPVFYPEKYGSFYYKEYPVRLIFKVGLTETAIEESKNIQSGETVTYYTNRWDKEVTTEAHFTPYDGEDNPNTYPFNELGEMRKEENTTGTHAFYLDTDVDGDNVTQRLGNNGRLVLTKESKTVSVVKKWSDETSHDPVTVHLLADGEIAEGKSVQLSDANQWTYTWTGLTKYHTDGTEIVYTVSEDYVAGYDSSIEKIAKGTEYTAASWEQVTKFEADKEYVLISQKSGEALAADMGDKFKWVEGIDVTAEQRPEDESVIWKAENTGESSRLQNKDTQKYMGYGGSTGSRYFVLSASNGTSIKYSDGELSFSISGLGTYTYYFTGVDNNGRGTASRNGDHEMFDLYQLDITTAAYPEDTFIITNTKTEEQPLNLTLKKVTDSGTVLTGAVFDLYMVNSEGTVTIPGAEASESKGKIVLKDITPDEDGITISIPKEDAIYYLVETEAPEGFILLKKPVRIVVKQGVISEKDEMARVDGNTLVVINKAGYVLPKTGGVGTNNYRIGGSALIAAAALIYIYNIILKTRKWRKRL